MRPGYGAVRTGHSAFTARSANPNEHPGTEFPGVELPNEPMPNQEEGDVVVSDPNSPTDKDADAMKGAMDEAVAAAKDCLDDCVEAYQKSYDKVKAGTYKADDIVQDMAAMWTRLIRDGATDRRPRDASLPCLGPSVPPGRASGHTNRHRGVSPRGQE